LLEIVRRVARCISVRFGIAMGKLVYCVATTVDGYIAHADGSFGGSSAKVFTWTITSRRCGVTRPS
jgi:hypothetical protein